MTRFNLELGTCLCDQLIIPYLEHLDEKKRARTLQALIIKDLQAFHYPPALPKVYCSIRSESGNLAQQFLELLARIPPRKRHDVVRFLLFQKLLRPRRMSLDDTDLALGRDASQPEPHDADTPMQPESDSAYKSSFPDPERAYAIAKVLIEQGPLS